MSLPEPVDLDALGALDRSRMHVFVAGPGKGEGIAIALPGKGWILIDGAQAALGDPSLLAIVERWRSPANDPVELCLLSHPHDDHVDGFVDVVEKLSPKRIALAGTDSAPRYVDILKDAPLPTATEDELKAKRVRAAFAAIRTWEEKTKRPAEAVCRSALPIFAASSSRRT
jgi:glyoxylase-like metal-dependent hydrolase (beta-lactamase superfamily II)